MGRREGFEDGCLVGCLVGWLVGCLDGCPVGCPVGIEGLEVGCVLGKLEGWPVGASGDCKRRETLPSTHTESTHCSETPPHSAAVVQCINSRPRATGNASVSENRIARRAHFLNVGGALGIVVG